jgi:hypothetical protein
MRMRPAATHRFISGLFGLGAVARLTAGQVVCGMCRAIRLMESSRSGAGLDPQIPAGYRDGRGILRPQPTRLAGAISDLM